MEDLVAPSLIRACGRRLQRLTRLAVLLGCLLAVLAAMAWGAPSYGDSTSGTAAEQRLAERYAPVVRLVAQPKVCGSGEPYRPSDVDPLFDNDTVALRGPWTGHDLIKVGPTAGDLGKGLPGYSLDFPGNPLDPGCSYEQWADATFADRASTVYAHVATEAGFAGRLAIQYWFYYPFNDFNNKHESDWEQIQVELDADSPQAALAMQPTRVVYSEHEGSEYADWGDSKLGIVDGTHPVVYVSAGSHANHFGEALYLGRSGSQGLGCDSTLDASTSLDPAVRTIPSDPTAAVRAFPWIDYEGTWGEQEARAFYTGPTGPNMKDAWDHPFTWSQDAASRSHTVPGGSVYGVKTTDFFCRAVGSASVVLLRFTDNPLPVLGVLAVALLFVVWLVHRTSWSSSEPLPATQQRTIGQTIADAWELFRKHPLLFLGIGGWVALAGVVTSLLAQLAAKSPGAGTAGSSDVWTGVTFVVLLVMTMLSQAATTASLAELDAGRPIGPIGAYRLALGRFRGLLGTALLWLLMIIALLATAFLAPLALVVFAAFALFVPVVQLEGISGFRALRRSAHLVHHQVVKVLLVLLLTAALVSLLGGLLGTIVILAVQAPFVVVNLIPGVVQALLGPFTSLMLGLAYYHGVARDREQPQDSDAEVADATP